MKISAFLCFLLFALPGSGQLPFPPPGPVFPENELSVVHVSIHPDSLAMILAEENSDLRFQASMIFQSAGISDTIDLIGFGLRGNTSLVSPKKSFQLDINHFIQGQEYFGLEKINLNGDHNDPSMMRSRLAWETYHRAGVPAPRCSYSSLFINGDYFGLYVNVEAIDEEFAELRFGNKDGNLYKCLWPADLKYLGSNPNAYKMESNGRRVYELKTNEDEDDYSDLAQFISILNNTPASSSSFPVQLESVFNVTSYLRQLAAEVLTGHWDGYSFNKNNFFLYHNTATGQFEYIPYDVDNTYGIDWFGIDWASRNIYSFYNTQESRPLTQKILSVPVYRDRFSFFLNQLMVQHFNTGILFPLIDQRKALISPFVQTDTIYPLNYGWDMADFQLSFNQGLGDHVPIGLKPYISQRVSSAQSQLQLHDIAPVISGLSHNLPLTGQGIAFSAKVEDETAFPVVRLVYRFGGSGTDSIAMTDDGQTADGQAWDKTFGAILPGILSPDSVHFYIRATDSQGRSARQPLTGWKSFKVVQGNPGTLVINELMADNLSTLTDEAGNFDDWIELLNTADVQINLGDYFLTDDPSVPDKWNLPQVQLFEGAYFIVWADDEADEGPNHASFKLSKSGEVLSLFTGSSGNFSLVDQVNFGAQASDFSFGRFPNGTGPFQVMQDPTPGEANSMLSNSRAGYSHPGFLAWIEGNQIMFRSGGSHILNGKVELISLQGQVLASCELRNLNPGIQPLPLSIPKARPFIFFFRGLNAEREPVSYPCILISPGHVF